MLIFKSEKEAKKVLKKNLSEQEREARYIFESFKASIAVWVLLGAFFGALGCLLGALGSLFCTLGCPWVYRLLRTKNP